jgi:hypothetical protein
VEKLIGISGKKCHGKDTLAEFIIEECVRIYHQPDFAKKTAFANPIKEIVLLMFPHALRDDVFGSSEKRETIIPGYVNPETMAPLTIRDVLLFVGEWGRKTNENCWVNATFGVVDKMLAKGNFVIISDTRRVNEAETIKKRGGKIIRIVRNDIGFTNNHPTEVDLDNYDFDMVVENTSMEALREAAKEIVQEFVL